MDDDNCLQLNDDPIQFVPASVSKTTNVFYDEITGQVNKTFAIHNMHLIKQDFNYDIILLLNLSYLLNVFHVIVIKL